MLLKAHVRSGKLVVDQSIDLPEGTELNLVLPDEKEDFDDDERRALDEALEQAADEAERGEGIDAEEAFAEMEEWIRK